LVNGGHNSAGAWIRFRACMNYFCSWFHIALLDNFDKMAKIQLVIF